MTEEEYKYIAGQLRKPSGPHGLEVGERLISSNADIYKHTLSILKPSSGDRILEVGMGMGNHVSEIVKAVTDIQYTGCDYSELMCKESQRINQVLIDNNLASFFQADVCSLPFDDSTFTKAFTVNTMYFWEDISKGLSEFFRVLKPEGILHVAGRPRHIMQEYPFAKYGFTMFDKKDIATLLREHRFMNIQIFEAVEEPRDIDGVLHDIETLIVSGTK